MYQLCRGKRGKRASVNWKLRRRLCARCLKAKYVHVSLPVAVAKLIVPVSLISVSKVKIRFPDINGDVLSLIPFTTGKSTVSFAHIQLIMSIFKARSGKRGPREDHYWMLDITDIQAKITELEAQPGSSKRLAEFRVERKTLVEDLNKVSANSVQSLTDLISFIHFQHAERCEVWVHTNARKKADDLQRLRDERFSM